MATKQETREEVEYEWVDGEGGGKCVQCGVAGSAHGACPKFGARNTRTGSASLHPVSPVSASAKRRQKRPTRARRTQPVRALRAPNLGHI